MRGFTDCFFFYPSSSFQDLLFPHTHKLCKNTSVLGGTVLNGVHRVSWGVYHLCGKPENSSWKNQMVRIIPFGVLLKLWASCQSDAFLLLLLGFTADVHTFCMLSIFC